MADIKLNSEQWVDRYGDAMYHYTLVRVKDSDAAEDIVQSTFIAGLKSQASFAGRSSEKSWLFGILKHKIMDHFRDQKKTLAFDGPAEDDPEGGAGPEVRAPKNWQVDPEKAAENQALVAALKECMDNLPEKFHRLFVLKEMEGLDTETICNEFGIKPTYLWVMLHRTRNQLKDCLDIRWFNKDNI